MHLHKVRTFVNTAVECSVHWAPHEPGLTSAEIIELGRQFGFCEGELSDAIQTGEFDSLRVGKQFRTFPCAAIRLTWGIFPCLYNPDFRNIRAFEYIHTELMESVRIHGVQSAKLDRNVIVERAKAAGMVSNDIEAAITIWMLSGHLWEKDGLVGFMSGRENYPSPVERTTQRHNGPPFNPQRAETYQHVKAIVERRTDGRSTTTEPLDEFAETLDRLGYGPFRLWWTQVLGELRRTNIETAPITACVLSAALVEGALSFIVRHAQKLGLPTMASKSFSENPRKWRLEDLLSSAAAGGD